MKQKTKKMMKKLIVFSMIALFFSCSQNVFNDVSKSLIIESESRAVTAERIEAEDYTDKNGVSTQACSEGTDNVGWTDIGDWMDYSVNVPTSGQYTVNYRVASPESTGEIQMKSGSSVLATTSVPNTGGWQNWTTVSASVNLTSGNQTIRIYVSSQGFNINWFELSMESSGDVGLIEAENYSAMYGIQTQACSEGTDNVGWTDAGDWMDYRVNVPTSGQYTVNYRVASPNSTGEIQMKSGSSVLATTSVPNTGGWQNWTTVSASVNLSSGNQTIRLYAEGININWYELHLKTNITPIYTISFLPVGDGDIKFSLTVESKKNQVHLFTRTNGVQDYEVMDLQNSNETQNSNGTYTYSSTRLDSFINGDLVEARFYTYSQIDGQVFYPGPDSSFDSITYNSNPIISASSKWQLPNAPDGSVPDQSWLAVGSDPEGNIYISGHDHQTNSMLYRLNQSDGTLSWVGDAKQASQDANNWENGETAEKFHTRPVYFDDRIYVATLDKSSMDTAYLSSRGFHWYAYDKSDEEFIDLSATDSGREANDHLQIVTIQVDPNSGIMYGMSIPENKIVSYDIASGETTVPGKPAEWVDDYFYSNRYMWVDSRGRLYITGGTERGQWNMGEDPNVFDSVWYYEPSTGLFGDTSFPLQGANSIEVGQWDREHKILYVSDDQGHIYRFVDDSATWEYLGAPEFNNPNTDWSANKAWVFNLSADGEKIYIGTSDNGVGQNEIWEFDINSRNSFKLCTISELDSTAGSEAFMTGYDTWDKNGTFYMSVFSMNDGDNVYLMGINPAVIKADKGISSGLVQVTVTQSGDDVTISKTGLTTELLEVLYEVNWLDSNSEIIETTYGEVIIPAGQNELTVSYTDIQEAGSLGIASAVISVVADGNDYILGDNQNAPIAIPSIQ